MLVQSYHITSLQNPNIFHLEISRHSVTHYCVWLTLKFAVCQRRHRSFFQQQKQSIISLNHLKFWIEVRSSVISISLDQMWIWWVTNLSVFPQWWEGDPPQYKLRKLTWNGINLISNVNHAHAFHTINCIIFAAPSP